MKLNIIALILTGSASFSSWAGPSTSGGGFAVVCRQSDGNIKTAELLDLYEGRELLKFQLMPSTGSLEEDYLRAVRNGYRLQGYKMPVRESEIVANLKRFENVTAFIGEGERLPNLNDLGLAIRPPVGCDIEPAAVFYDEQYRIEIDREIWMALNSLNRAALILHEVNYHHLRSLSVNPDRDSLDARALTAANFATNLTPVRSGITSSDRETVLCANVNPMAGEGCDSPTVFFKLRQIEAGGAEKLVIQFTHLAGRILLDRTTITIPLAVSSGQTFPIESKQLHGYTAQVVKNPSRGAWAVKLHIMRGPIKLVELLL